MNKTALLLLLLLFCTFYQDFPLVNFFGEIARTPIFIVVPPMLFYLLSFKRLVLSNYTKYFIYYILYLFVISAIHLIYLVLSEQTFTFLRENIILKTIKMSIYPIIALIYYQFFCTFLKRGEDTLNNLFDALYILQIFFAIYLLFEIYFLKSPTIFLPFLHSISDKFWKVRLLTLEESYVGNVITFFVFIPIFLVNYLNKTIKIKKNVYCLSAYFIVLYTFFCESKGYLFLLLLSVLPLTLKHVYENPNLKKYLILILTPMLIIIVIIFIYLEVLVSEQLSNNNSGTFGTRFTSVFSSLKLFVKHPFGVGWSGFIYYYPEEIKNTLDSILVNGLDKHEVKGYLSTSKALSTKTEFFDGLIYGGIGFLYFYYNFFIRRYFKLSKIEKTNLFFLKIPMLFSILAGLIYINYTIKYEIWFLMALIDTIEYKYKHEEQ